MSSSSRSVSFSPRAWGNRALVVDTSAWVRAHRPTVRESWQRAMIEDRLRLSPATRLEILYSARDGAAVATLAAGLAGLRTASLTRAITATAEATLHALAEIAPGAHRMPPVDYLLAATAHEINAAVIHYDRHFDILATVLPFQSVWLAPPGSLD